MFKPGMTDGELGIAARRARGDGLRKKEVAVSWIRKLGVPLVFPDMKKALTKIS